MPLPAELSLILNLFLDIMSCIPSWVLTPCVAKDDWTSCPSMCTSACWHCRHMPTVSSWGFSCFNVMLGSSPGLVCVRQALFQLSYISRPQVVLLFEVFFSFHVYACMWLCALECRCLGGRSRGQIPGSCSRWVLGREFKFSGRAASALTAKASLQPYK